MQMKIEPELYSLAEAAKLLECSESSVLECGAFPGPSGSLTLSVFVVGEIEATSDNPYKGRFSVVCPLEEMEIRSVIANGKTSTSVYALLARKLVYEHNGIQTFMDDEVFVREPVAGGGWCYRYKSTTEKVEISNGMIKVQRKDLADFKQRLGAHSNPQDGVHVTNTTNQISTQSTKYLAQEAELMHAFGCPKSLFENVRKIPWALEARKIKGRGGKIAIASEFDPLAFAENLPGTAYAKGMTSIDAWSKFEKHFPDRYSEVEAYDPRKIIH